VSCDGRVGAGEQTSAPSAVRTGPVHIRGLDGIRGLAALFVVVHHCYVLSCPGFPRMTGPWWAGWMIYGHLAVVVFIVLSGFSLAVAPAARGWRLGSPRRYAHRRAWRILSAYWPALAFSFAMAWLFVPQPGEAPLDARSAVVYGLLLQDVTGAPNPNGAFWSIAIEAQLYVVLPLLVLLVRRAGLLTMLLLVSAPVLVVGTFAASVPVLDLFTRFTPQLAFGFAMGVWAAGLAARQGRSRIAWGWLALAAAVPPVVVIYLQGSVWAVEHFFWVDLAVTPAVALLLTALARGRARPAGAVLDVAPLRRLGAFSYSLYLVHAPIVVAVGALVVIPRAGTGTRALLLMLAIALPLALLVSRAFAAVFDLPFQRHKSWSALLAETRRRWRGRRGRSAGGKGTTDEVPELVTQSGA
jgi:peptidoglycan/LPS O-acetylase OafA/YrhL